MISMSSLKISFEEMGFTDVTTYINSGNIIFRAKPGQPRNLEQKIERMLSQEYELERKVVVRDFDEMAKLIKSLPRTWGYDKGWSYNVVFLRHSIDAKEILNDLNAKSEIEKVIYRPGTLLWATKTSDAKQSVWTRLPSKKPFQDMTVRNLNTTKKIYELMKSKDEG